MKEKLIRSQMWLAGLIPTALADDPPAVPTNVASYSSFIKAIDTIAGWMYGILMALGVVFVLYAAFLYLIAQGNQERIDVAKRVLIYAIVALVIGSLAGGVSSLVADWAERV